MVKKSCVKSTFFCVAMFFVWTPVLGGLESESEEAKQVATCSDLALQVQKLIAEVSALKARVEDLEEKSEEERVIDSGLEKRVDKLDELAKGTQQEISALKKVEQGRVEIVGSAVAVIEKRLCQLERRSRKRSSSSLSLQEGDLEALFSEE